MMGTVSETEPEEWHDDDPVGDLEIAERLDVEPGTVGQWKKRFPAGHGHPFPPARGTVSGKEWRRWGEVLAWWESRPTGAAWRVPA